MTRSVWRSRSAACAAGLWALLQLVVQAQPEPLLFRATTALIQFTLVAVDGSGRPVVDLTKEDLQVLEDGRPREVAFLQYEREAIRTTRVDPLPRGTSAIDPSTRPVRHEASRRSCSTPSTRPPRSRPRSMRRW